MILYEIRRLQAAKDRKLNSKIAEGEGDVYHSTITQGPKIEQYWLFLQFNNSFFPHSHFSSPNFVLLTFQSSMCILP